MLLETSASSLAPPQIVTSPKSLSAKAGSEVGFLVEASGLGLGFQWYRNGQPVLAPDGYNESDTAALRLSNVQAADAGEYKVEVFNQAGKVASVPVTLTVTP